MLLSKSEEEININRKLAEDLVNKWVSNTPFNFCFIIYDRDSFKSTLI